MKRIFMLIFSAFLTIQMFSQDTSSQADTLRKDALNVFTEASDYLKKEIPYVNYVRDIKDAGLYIITAKQSTGSGGTEFTYFLVGQHQYSGMTDTLTFVTSPDETYEETRQKEVSTLKMGLMRYVAKTPLSKYMKITFTEPLTETVSTDKLDSWVFRLSFNGYLDGQKSLKSSYLNGNFSASRITADWKINMNARYNYSVDRFVIDSSTLKSENNSKSFNSLIVKSISDHWSVGGSISVSSSSYNNLNFSASLMPGIEYDIFPYSESTRRHLRLLYRAGYNYADYNDTTIYNKTWESLWMHSLSASYQVVQKWGSIDISLMHSNYLHDWSKNNLTLEGFIDLRIAKGLNLNLGGGGSLIHDQLGLV